MKLASVFVVFSALTVLAAPTPAIQRKSLQELSALESREVNIALSIADKVKREVEIDSRQLVLVIVRADDDEEDDVGLEKREVEIDSRQLVLVIVRADDDEEDDVGLEKREVEIDSRQLVLVIVRADDDEEGDVALEKRKIISPYQREVNAADPKAVLGL